MTPYRLCEVDVSDLLPLLGQLEWRMSGARPWDGLYGMIGWNRLRVGVQQAIEHVAGRVLDCLPERRRGTTWLARLAPGRSIEAHRDAEDNGCTVRIHVPLLTNIGAVFLAEGKRHHLAAGSAWVIDPTEEHGVANTGTTDRVHLIFNAVAG